MVSEQDIEDALDAAFASLGIKILEPHEIDAARLRSRDLSVKRMYDQGMTRTQIAKELNLSSEYIGRILGDFEYDTELARCRTERNKKIVAEYESGLLMKEIAKNHGLTTQAISRILSGYGYRRGKKIR